MSKKVSSTEGYFPSKIKAPRITPRGKGEIRFSYQALRVSRLRKPYQQAQRLA
jgi:hypothetical protein